MIVKIPKKYQRHCYLEYENLNIVTREPHEKYLSFVVIRKIKYEPPEIDIHVGPELYFDQDLINFISRDRDYGPHAFPRNMQILVETIIEYVQK